MCTFCNMKLIRSESNVCWDCRITRKKKNEHTKNQRTQNAKKINSIVNGFERRRKKTKEIIALAWCLHAFRINMFVYSVCVSVCTREKWAFQYARCAYKWDLVFFSSCFWWQKRKYHLARLPTYSHSAHKCASKMYVGLNYADEFYASITQTHALHRLTFVSVGQGARNYRLWLSFECYCLALFPTLANWFQGSIDIHN